MEKPRPLRDQINKGRAKLDFDASLLVVLNGKEVAGKINWENWLRKADIAEKKMEVQRNLLKKATEKNNQHRRAWLEYMMMQNVNSHDSASSPAELESNLIARTTSLKNMIPKDTTLDELYEIMKTLRREEVLKLVTKIEYSYEIDETKMNSREKANLEQLLSNHPP